ncbi:hypothetical protein G7054_g13404 [Neopestalotiopsis clavispora]|nr:hypothetical protein G7054_g13404 [Neopestalotiopsis clavispora]
MASNTSEGEERIIALLTELVENNSNDDSDRLAQTANTLSTAAMTVSIVALVIGLLQALLQYASSNENHRGKCNIGAIGRAAMLSGRSKWSWRHWRRTYTYPVLHLSPIFVFECLAGGEHDIKKLQTIFKDAVLLSRQHLNEDGPMGHSGTLGWLERPDVRSRMISRWPWRLCHIDQDGCIDWVQPRHLPLLQRLRWWWYSLLQPKDERPNPRATWAQLLEALGIVDIKPLVVHNISAECIASSIDVPTQKVALQELGVLAFHLKMRTVKIDLVERTFLAIGPSGSISTEDLPGFGKVVRFQSYGYYSLGYRSPFLRKDHSSQLFGRLCFGDSEGRSIRREWHHAIHSSGGTPRMLTNERNSKAPWSLATSEGELWEKLGSLPSWREEHRRYDIVWPTIFLVATAACLPGETLGFPSRIMVRPFLECLSHWAVEVGKRCYLHGEPAKDRKAGFLDVTVIGKLQRMDLCQADLDDLPAVYGVCELSSWAFWQVSTDTLEQVESQLCDSDEVGTGIEAPGLDFLFHSEFMTSGDTQGTHRIFNETVSLLVKYELDSWSTRILEDRFSSGVSRQPQNVLWTQVLVLDLTIRDLLNSCPPGPEPLTSQDCSSSALWRINVNRAVVQAWSDPDAEWPMQNLEHFLIGAFNIKLADAENRDRMMKLSNLIHLRALFFLAYLMVLPDSSDLYRASQQEDVILPMI